MSRRRARTWLLAGVVSLWLAASATGMAALWRYKMTPGAAAAAPAGWPAGSALARDPERPTLVMLAHPRCACTRASLHELAVLMSRFHGGLAATVVFVRPPGVAAGWERSDLWQTAAAIPGVAVLADPEGREAARFGGAVSGQTLVYEPGGRLLFAGGITGARGHEGDNPGRSRLTALLAGQGADRAASPVFGCELAEGPSPSRALP